MNHDGGSPTGATGNGACPLGTNPRICGTSEQFIATQVMLKRLGTQLFGCDLIKKGEIRGVSGRRQDEFELGVTVIMGEVTASESLPAAIRKERPDGKGRVGAKMPACSEGGGVTVKLNGTAKI